MGTLLEQLEGLLDELGKDDMEVDYHVSSREALHITRVTSQVD